MTDPRPILTFLLIFLVFFISSSHAQSRKYVFMTKDIQVSLVPGVNSNGLNSAQYFNKFSLNLLAGISAGNKILELGIISNASTFRVTGIQVAGIANVVGTNAFIVEPDEKLKSRDEEKFTPDFHGLQFAGFINYVDENVKGLQFSGAFNAVRKDLNGVQVSGFGNTVGGQAAGIQIAALYNLSGGDLSGTQVGLVNKTRSTGGKNSSPFTKSRGLQVGLLNLNKQSDGLQIGMVNLGGKGRGIQFGLINFYDPYPSKDNVKQGIPVGLLNFGSRGPKVRVYNNEMFLANVEYTSGQCRNCSALQSEMPFEGNNQVYYSNSLIIGSNLKRDLWGLGYGFQRLMYNKVTPMPSPDNRKRVFAYGVRFRYLYHSNTANSFNLLSTLNIDYGKRFGWFYVYGAVTMNHFFFEGDTFEGLPVWAKRIGSKGSQAIWPGYGVGIMF